MSKPHSHEAPPEPGADPDRFVPYRSDLEKVERAAVRAWPAPHTWRQDGWLCRWSGGGFRRANSVAALEFAGEDAEAAIDRVEADYRALGLPARFSISDVSEPRDLDRRLARRGYLVDAPCLTLAKPAGAPPASLEGIEWSHFPSPQWLKVYFGVIDEARRRAAADILAAVPWPRAFIVFRKRGITLSAGLAVRDEEGIVRLECIATREETRRRGGARAILAGSEAWAHEVGGHTLCLQVAADNLPALQLYKSLGFERVGRMHYRVPPPGAVAPLPDDGARHLMPGTPLAPVALPASNGQTIDPTSLPHRTVLFLYPWTGRPGLANPPDWDDILGAHGSTPEAEGFRDLHPVFRAMGVAVLGASGQDGDHHQELIGRLRLPFALLSDAHGRLRQAWRLPTFRTGGVDYLKRLTLVIRRGRLEHAFYPVHPPAGHARQVLDWLAANPPTPL